MEIKGDVRLYPMSVIGAYLPFLRSQGNKSLPIRCLSRKIRVNLIMEKRIETLLDWIEYREVRGYYTFTKEDIERQFPAASKVYMKTALHRLVAKSRIISPWRNFYVIMPVEYLLKGIIPPVFYMDQLMSYLGKKYYVSLLNAASFYGASHQRVQTFSVMVEQPSLRNTSKNGTPILFFSKKEIRMEFIKKHKTQTGYINVSSPELTAIDLIENEKNVGGLNRVCTVLNELSDAMNLDSLDDSFFNISTTPVFQRLGLILEHSLGREELAETLYSKIEAAELKLRKVPFKINKPTDGCEVDKRWKVIVNQEIEIDE